MWVRIRGKKYFLIEGKYSGEPLMIFSESEVKSAEKRAYKARKLHPKVKRLEKDWDERIPEIGGYDPELDVG